MARTRQYPKGIAKREEILDVALRVIAEQGYTRATVRQLASAVGLSKTGLLHHFGSKEELFTEILKRREEVDHAHFREIAEDPATVIPAIVRRNAETTGLVQLYACYSAEATDREHAAYDFFAERYRYSRERYATLLRTLQAQGRLAATADPEKLGAVILAAMDGLQTQWLFDPDVDMAQLLGHLLEALGVLDGSAADTPPRARSTESGLPS